MIINLISEIEEVQKLILFDRDGTINIDPGYISHPDYPEITKEFLSLAKVLQNENVVFGIVTNQSGIAKSKFDIQDVFYFHQNLMNEITKLKISISLILICPHQETDGCFCRKPSPLMLNTAMKLSHISTKETLFVGNSDSDRLSARNARIEYVDIKNPALENDVISWCSK